MKIYLHGWFDDNNYDRNIFFSQLQKIFDIEWIQEVLHVPFAHVWVREKQTSREEGWFVRQFPNIAFLDARYIEDINQVDISRVFVLITWGKTGRFLMETIFSNPQLKEIIENCTHIFASAAGMKSLWIKYSKKWTYTEALWIINYIGEGHVTQLWRRHLLDEHIVHYPEIDFSLGVEKDTIVEWKDWILWETRGEGKSYIVKT